MDDYAGAQAQVHPDLADLGLTAQAQCLKAECLKAQCLKAECLKA